MKKGLFLVILMLFILIISGCGGSGGGKKTPTPPSDGPTTPTDPIEPNEPTGPELTLDSNTVALWHFNENTGTIAYDSTSNDRDLTFSASPKDPQWVDSGRTGFGSCLLLDTDSGSIDNVSWVCDPADTSFTGNQFTIECWIKVESIAAFQTIFDVDKFKLAMNKTIPSDGGEPYGSVILQIQDDEDNSKQITAVDSKIYTGQWYYIATTYSKTDGMKLYVNGLPELCLGDDFSGNISPNIYGYYFSITSNPCINGMIDEIRLSNKARSATKIANYYQQASN